MTRFSPPRGTQDLLPPASESLRLVALEAARTARLFGFAPVETPTFEHTELFVRGVGESTDIVTKEMYTFEDKGGRSLTLRPEGTAPVMRAYLAGRQGVATPLRAYYLAPMFRHERPQAGRMREHRQFGVEIIGTGAPLADVEVIELAHRFLGGFGLSFELRVSSIGDPVCRPAHREALVAFLEDRRDRLSPDCVERIRTNPLRVFDCKVASCREATADAPSILDFLDEACKEHFAAVRAGLEEAGIEHSIDPRLVRGLDYYTRTTFEFVSPVLGPTQSTLCGGGRYDGLAEALGGEPAPGIGFGLGLERVLVAMERQGLELPRPDATSVFVVAIGDEARREARALVRSLREQGVAAGGALEERPLKAQLRMADRSGATHAAIIGDRELAEGAVTIRRLADGAQERVESSEVVAWISR